MKSTKREPEKSVHIYQNLGILNVQKGSNQNFELNDQKNNNKVNLKNPYELI